MGSTFMTWSLALVLLLISILYLYRRVTKRIVTRLRSDQVPASDFGIVPVDGFGSQAYSGGVDIIFVHGLGSNPDTTWTAQTPQSKSAGGATQRVCWIRDFLPQDLPPAIREKTRVFFYNHDSYWQRDAVQTRPWSLGEGFLQRIRTSIRNDAEARERNLIFVGYSYGGLIIKQALIQARRNQGYADILDHTKAILFLGTPHIGSDFVSWGTLIARVLQPIGSNPSILREVAFGSVPIRDLHRDFLAVVDNKVRIVNFFEMRPTRVAKLWFFQWDAFFVQEESARYDSSGQNIGLAVDHFGLNKFGSRTSDEYKTVYGKLLECLEQSTTLRIHGRYSVPLNIVPTFVERSELSSALEERLCSAGIHNTPFAILIHGLGGTGKTQLALKYIEDHRDIYDPILWIDAKDPEAVRSSFQRCADELRLSVDETPATGSVLADSRTIQAVLRFLRDQKDSEKRWLIVVDNADDMSWEIKTILPQMGHGSVIITSQDSKARRLLPKCEELRLDTMSIVEARALLVQHLKWDSDSIPPHIQRLCDDIVERLGYLALAIDLAGAYIGNEEDQEEALAQYLADFGKHQDDLLQRDHFRGLSETKQTVWTVWDKTLYRIQELEPKVRPDLLLAFLAHFRGGIIQDELLRLASLGFSVLKEVFSDEVPPEGLGLWIKLDDDEWNTFYYRTARDLLIRYSLLRRVNGEWPGVTMHSLVRWRARKYGEGQSWEVWYLLLIAGICYQIIENTNESLFRQHMIPHIPENSKSELESQAFNIDKISFIGLSIGNVYQKEGRFKEAEELVFYVMEGSKRVLGVEDPVTLNSMNTLVVMYLDQGQWTKAEELSMQVLESRTRVLGPEHPATLNSMANLASTYQRQGRFEKAEERGMQVKETMKRVLGAQHPTTLSLMGDLASTYWSQGRWKDAEELKAQVFEMRRRVLGAEHPDTLNSMFSLVLTYWRQRRWTEAEDLGTQVLQMRKRVLGAEHPHTLFSMGILAVTQRCAGRDIEAALQLMKKSVALLGQNHGTDHPSAVSARKMLTAWEKADSAERS